MRGSAVPFWFTRKRSLLATELLFSNRSGPETRAVGPQPLIALVPAGPGALVAELLDREAASAFAAEWGALAARALEPNIFFDPACALAAAEHLARRRPLFVFVWEAFPGTAARGKLIAVCPLDAAPRFGRRALTNVFGHKQAVLGVPLIDWTRADDAIAAILSFCREALPRSAGLGFRMIALDGPVAVRLRRRAQAAGLPIRLFEAGGRAVLAHGRDASAFLARSLSAKRLRKLQRQRRRLEARGEVRLRVAQEVGEVRRAAEEFLALEASGWKGKRGTALLNAPRLATYARTLTRCLAAEGRCRVLSLDVDSAPVAMAIVLRSGDRAFVWKVAYDEAFAAFSPGVQLILELTRTQLADASVGLTDSCADPGHPMIEHIWPDRIVIGDLYIGLHPGRTAAFAAAVQREALWRGARAFLKGMLRRRTGGSRSFGGTRPAG